MAEYYPLLARAVAGMRNAPPDKRRDVYDRARQALLGQLRSMQPPVPEESITRESTALDEAIARVEAEITAEAAPPAAPVVVPAAPEPVVVPAPPEPPPPAPQPIVPPPERQPALTAQPAPAPIVVAPSRSGGGSSSRPAADALTRIVSTRAAPAPVQPPPEADAPAGGAGRPVPTFPSAPTLQVPSFADALVAAADSAATEPDDRSPDETEPAAVAQRDEPSRPLAPRPVVIERFNPRFLIMALAGAAVVAGIAYAAWRLRDKPEALVRSRDAMIAARQTEQQTKLSTRVDSGASKSDRAGGTGVAPAASPPTPADAPAVAPLASPAMPSQGAAAVSNPAATAPAAGGATPQASPPAPMPSSDGTAVPDPSRQTAAPAVSPPAAVVANSAIAPVAQRAAFLVDAPDDPQKVKTYVGTVVWSTDNANPAQGQPITRTVHADVDIPDAAMKMSMVFQKNDEAQFPASHTMELRFILEAGNTIGAVKQINVPQMRQNDTPAGDALTGLPVTITDNYFLVGLSRGDATSRNLDLIRTRNWFDIPILMASGKVAKITFEKGLPGQKAIDDVIQSWQ